MSNGEWDSLIDQHLEYDAVIQRSGHFLVGAPLEPVAAASLVRVRGGKVSVTDGPFAETKEQLGGFILIEARDLNEAIAGGVEDPGGALRDHRGAADSGVGGHEEGRLSR